MENATKAMQIAAGVLMSVLVLGLLVYGYNSITESKDIEQQAVREEQAADFNKSFETYNRDLVGTELIALSNKVDDYNKRYPESEGYTKISFNVTNIKTEYENNYKKTSPSVSLSSLHLKISKAIDLEAEKIYTNNNTNEKYKYSELYKLSQIKLNNILNAGDTRETVLGDYEKLIESRENFAREKFQCTKWEYDNYGRIASIEFKMI